MNAQALQDALYEMLPAIPRADGEFDVPADLEVIRRVSTFADGGVLTTNAGLVLRMKGGAEFQLTIIRSR